ncbi:MAG: hypothetical protein ACREC6_09005 [Hyphomicrobiaceae bacterium]
MRRYSAPVLWTILVIGSAFAVMNQPQTGKPSRVGAPVAVAAPQGAKIENADPASVPPAVKSGLHVPPIRRVRPKTPVQPAAAVKRKKVRKHLTQKR